MNFCQKCGRQRGDDARFCGGCGAEFAAPAADGETPLAAGSAAAAEPVAGLPEPADATRWDRPADATRWDDPPPAATRADPVSAEPNPFASWFAPEVPKDPVFASPTQELSFPLSPPPPPSPRQPASGYPPPRGPGGFSPPPRRSSGGKKAGFFLVALLMVTAAGGGAYFLISRPGRQSTARPATRHTVHGATAAASAANSASASASPPASQSAPASASPGASPTPKPAPKPSPSLLSVAKGVAANPAEPQVKTVLTHYFQGIDSHDYTVYASALDARERAKQPRSFFDRGYATTSDSGIRLTSITNTGNGGLTATVTFTSHQAPADSVDKSACNSWTLSLYLVPSGTGYLIGQAPPGYQPTYSDC